MPAFLTPMFWLIEQGMGLDGYTCHQYPCHIHTFLSPYGMHSALVVCLRLLGLPFAKIITKFCLFYVHMTWVLMTDKSVWVHPLLNQSEYGCEKCWWVRSLRCLAKKKNLWLQSQSKSSIKSSRSNKNWALETNFHIKGFGNDRLGCYRYQSPIEIFKVKKMRQISYPFKAWNCTEVAKKTWSLYTLCFKIFLKAVPKGIPGPSSAKNKW